MFRVKQYMKMFLQNVFLPRVYDVYARKPIQKGLILFADAHHEEMPFSMRRMYEEVLKLAEAETVQVYVRDFNKMSYGAMLKYLVHFMKQYAVAEYVFICDYYLPVAACRKRPETKVVQLWHSCGLMKKIAYDTGQDIPENYKGNMFGNYTYLTLSAEACVQVHADALRIPKERIRATGVSRTDYYFDQSWNQRCRENFYRQHPQAAGKKIALWAPTFRGNAAHPVLTGLKEIRAAQEALSEEWYFILKAHPHIDAHGQVSNCTIPTEELLCVADVLITDYSSVLFDYLIYEKPVILFAPDLEEYESDRGFYIDYRSLPFPLVQDGNALTEAIAQSGHAFENYKNALVAWKEKYTGACDGNATRRILELIRREQ
jgi:CDP-ribitol ribitolphosphotransferase